VSCFFVRMRCPGCWARTRLRLGLVHASQRARTCRRPCAGRAEEVRIEPCDGRRDSG
jgi:hypothetical protein